MIQRLVLFAAFFTRVAARAHQRNVCQGNECIGEKFASLDAVRLELGLSEFIYFITRGKKRNYELLMILYEGQMKQKSINKCTNLCLKRHLL